MNTRIPAEHTVRHAMAYPEKPFLCVHKIMFDRGVWQHCMDEVTESITSLTSQYFYVDAVTFHKIPKQMFERQVVLESCFSLVDIHKN